MSHAIEAYREITATEEFKFLERLRTRARHDEAQALRYAERCEREKWQSVVADKETIIADKEAVIADKEAVIERLNQELAELRSRQA